MDDIKETIKEKKSLYTEAQKRATYNWRGKNKQKWNDYMKDINFNFRHNDIEANRLRNNTNYRTRQDNKYTVISKIFLKILL